MTRALAAAFGAVAGWRAGAYRRGLLAQRHLRGPVISVGNLSVGGNAKTPVVAYIAAFLRDAGLPVAVLSRGYRGSFRGEVLVVGDGERVLAAADASGDEPLMLARQLARVVVAVGPRRDVVGRAVEDRYGARVHVLDDGFQHLRLFRDLDVLCLDLRDLDDRPLPAGRLRERPAAARRADVVLVTGPDDASEGDLARAVSAFGPDRTHRVRRRPLGLFDAEGVAADPRRPFLVASIARPERFAADARALGPEIAGQAFFPDHHALAAAELAEVSAQALAAGADALVTTAKDLVRWPASIVPLPVLVLRFALDISDETRFQARLLEVARRAA